jgi:small subunit ribosomal protein S20
LRAPKPSVIVGGVPNIKAAEKWVRQTQKRSVRNKDTKTRLKTTFKKAVDAQDAAVTQNVESEFDRAAKRAIIHKNKAARKKSRLAKAIAKASSEEKAPKTRTASAKKTKKA